MKRILTFDKANKPYGFPQLDISGSIPSNITASFALTASYALNGGGTTIDTGSLVTTSSFNNFTSSAATTGSNIFTDSQIINAGGIDGFGSGLKYANPGFEHYTAGVSGSTFVVANTSANQNAVWASPIIKLQIGNTDSTLNNNLTVSGSVNVSGTVNFNNAVAINDANMNLTNSSSLNLTSGSGIFIDSGSLVVTTGSVYAPNLNGAITNLTAPGAGGIFDYDCLKGTTFVHFGVDATADWQVNLINFDLPEGCSTSIKIITSNADTSGHTWKITGFKINGVPQIWTKSWTNGARNTMYIYKFTIVNTVSGIVVYGERATTVPA